jgi:hypothetical protein
MMMLITIKVKRIQDTGDFKFSTEFNFLEEFYFIYLFIIV